MFEQPGMKHSDNLKDDVENLRRWLCRFVPELEMQLDSLGVDNFTNAYNERMEGLTSLSEAGKQKTTSEALAEHLLDTKNPHKTTLAQLGYKEPTATVEGGDDYLIIRFGGLVVQIKFVALGATTATAAGNVYRHAVDCGDWPVKFESLYATTHSLNTTTNCWAGSLRYQDNEHCGSVYIFSAAASTAAGTLVIIGIGGPEYGD